MVTVARRQTNTFSGENHTVVYMTDGEILKYSCQEKKIEKHNEQVQELIDDYMAGCKAKAAADKLKDSKQGDAFSY